MTILLIYVAVVAVMSLIAFIVYFADKRKAIKGKWRIKESVLLGLGLLGGAVGALVAMSTFRHKTKHWYFWAGNIFFLVLHIAVAIWICIKFV